MRPPPPLTEPVQSTQLPGKILKWTTPRKVVRQLVVVNQLFPSQPVFISFYYGPLYNFKNIKLNIPSYRTFPQNFKENYFWKFKCIQFHCKNGIKLIDNDISCHIFLQNLQGNFLVKHGILILMLSAPKI